MTNSETISIVVQYVLIALCIVSWAITLMIYIKTHLNEIEAKNSPQKNTNIKSGEELINFLNSYIYHICSMEFKLFALNHDISKITRDKCKIELVEKISALCYEYITGEDNNEVLIKTDIFKQSFIQNYIVKSVMLNIEELLSEFINNDAEGEN